MNRMLLFFVILFSGIMAQGQIVVLVTVDSGLATSECTDPFGGAPDPLFAVAVEGGSYTYYPEISDCYTALPDTSFVQNYACPLLVPVMVEVCLRVTENDALLGPPFNCAIVESCTETICDNFIVPPFGSTANYAIAINVPGSSSGEANFTIETTGFAFPDNDFICNAVDFGMMGYGDTLGDMTQGTFANLCATNIGEVDPISLGGDYTNQHGVWFTFNSGPTPTGLFVVEALSDPNNVGEPIDLEMVVFTTDNNACDGNLQIIGNFQHNTDGFDHEIRFPCPIPNINYYIWIDGSNNNNDFQGVFGLQVWDVGVLEGGDLRCDFTDLGIVPVGGSVSTPEPLSNFCATDVQDPFLPTFVSQHSVWLSFVAPPSGHVIIEGIAVTDKEPLGIQLALYRSFNNSCSGFFSYVISQFTPADLDEVMEVTCLYPGRRYFVLVDGSGSASKGVFEMTITDAGDITPVTDQAITLCFGESLPVGNTNHSLTGMYADTLQLFQGCDSIVNTNLIILDELVPSVTQTQPAIGVDGMDGVATVDAIGGEGNYTYAWCTGETSMTAIALVAGQTCCVTVTDGNACEAEICFEVEFSIAIIPVFENDSLSCFGDNDGSLTISAINGLPPYQYVWQEQGGALNGNGSIDTEGGSFSINNLPAGAYDVTINDAFLDTTFTAFVIQPDELIVELIDATNTSCFGVCDGSISTAVIGGTLPYIFNWSAGEDIDDTVDITDLCARNYFLEIVDDNDCVATLSTDISEPNEFIASPSVFQEVSCFEGADGIAVVLNNGNAVAWNWDNGATAEIAEDLEAGTYFVTVTNGDGCMDTTSISIPQPIEPLVVSIQGLDAISCFNANDGQLGTTVTGPFTFLDYEWNTEGATATINNLTVGNYDILVTNEKGCEAIASFIMTQPTEILAETFAIDINCVDGPTAGAVIIENVSGGTPGYTFGLEGGFFGESPMVEGLEAGVYPITVRDAEGCELIISTTILPPPEIFVLLGIDHEIKLGEQFIIESLTASENEVYTWSHADTLQTGTAIVRPIETTIYHLSIIDTVTHCTAKDTIQIFVDQRPRVFAPNVFSPNEDGRNDNFFIFGGSDVVNIASFRIFARNGQLVYEKINLHPADVDNGWDGRVNGELMNNAVFVYVAELTFLDGRTDVIKGDVLLLR